MPETVFKTYFPKITTEQESLLNAFAEHIVEWNDKINLISRKDIENIHRHHILHSLMIMKMIKFKEAAEILDLGTGGGFPGIPLAICFPETNFLLIDARAKKIMVVNEFIEKYGLKNVKAKHIRAEDINLKFDFVVSRAVASLDKLMGWSRRLIKNKESHAIPNGVIALKGGDVKQLKLELPKHEYIETLAIEEILEQDYFKEKYVFYIQA